jgi:hypothetical protein
VLHGAGKKPAGLERDALALFVGRVDLDVTRSGDITVNFGKTEAAFRPVFGIPMGLIWGLIKISA